MTTTDFAPFAPTAFPLPKQLAPHVKKETGHIFAECPAVDTPAPKGKKDRTCPLCWQVLTEIGRRQRVEQEAFDMAWHAAQAAAAAAPDYTPPPLPVAPALPKEEAPRPMTTTTTTNTATERQLSFLKDLFAERKGNADVMAIRQAMLAAYKEGKLTAAAASQCIDAVKKFPKDAKEGKSYPPLPDVPAGHYAVPSEGHNDLVFLRIDRPQEGRFAGRTFGKMIIGGQPESPIPFAQLRTYVGRILDQGIDRSQMLYGQEIGRCYRCNRTLTDAGSRAAGIGPECAKAS